MAKHKGIPFQTRLMLTMLAVVVGVMIALTMASERKIKDAYTAQFIDQKARIVEEVETLRADRSRDSLDLFAKIAQHPFIISYLQDSDSTNGEQKFWSDCMRFIQDSKPTPPERADGERGGADRAKAETLNRLPYFTLVDTDLEVERIQHPGLKGGSSRKGSSRRPPLRKNPRFREIIEQILVQGTQQILFIPMPTPSGNEIVQEVIATPVLDSTREKSIGLLLQGSAADVETRKAFLGTDVLNGIYLGETLYTQRKDESIADSAAQLIQTRLSKTPPETSIRFDGEVLDRKYRFHIDRLSEPGAEPVAFQTIAFPLDQMEADLNELRIRGSGIGIAVLLVGWIASYLLARNLAIPLRELSKGTEAIRNGALDHRVEVRSRDEIGELAESFNAMAEELKQKALYRELLGKVSDESVAQALVSGSLDLELGGELKEVSVLFCDIREFTDLTQDMHPSDVIDFLNEHMSAMTEIVRRHYGVVDKFVGDEIMAVFGGLKSYGNDAGHAVSCALDMIGERERLNRQLRETKGLPDIEIGIGIATGEVIAGCMGSSDRLNYTVLGARVNLAARLCGKAGRMEVVVDRATAEAADPNFATELIPDLRLKGFREAVEAFRVHSTAPQETIKVPQIASASDKNTEA